MSATALKPVTEKALMGRINRKFAYKYEGISKRRSGEFDYVDFNLNYIVAENVDLEDFARECGALREWEGLAS
jgi:hypothetical protein